MLTTSVIIQNMEKNYSPYLHPLYACLQTTLRNENLDLSGSICVVSDLAHAIGADMPIDQCDNIMTALLQLLQSSIVVFFFFFVGPGRNFSFTPSFLGFDCFLFLQNGHPGCFFFGGLI
jgi:hypothetical protein